MGVFLFLTHYVIAATLLYTILFCSHETEYVNRKFVAKKERMKYPLWAILVGITIFFIPILNIIAYIIYIGAASGNDEIYFDSFLTKKI